MNDMKFFKYYDVLSKTRNVDSSLKKCFVFTILEVLSCLSQEKLQHFNCKSVWHPPYSLALVPNYFQLFPKLKMFFGNKRSQNGSKILPWVFGDSIISALKNWYHIKLNTMTAMEIMLTNKVKYYNFVNKVLCYYNLFLFNYHSLLSG